MNRSQIIGASQILLRSSLFLACAANIAKDMFNDQATLDFLKNFEHDLAFIHAQISKLSQYPNSPETVTLDNCILKVYNFDALEQLLDHKALVCALERVPNSAIDIQPQIQIQGFPALADLYRLASYRPNLSEPLSYVKSLQGRVCFIKASGLEPVLLKALLNANGHLQSDLHSMAEIQRGRQQLHRDNISLSRASSWVPIADQETLQKDIGPQFDFERSRGSLKALYKALHSTWPDHSNCDFGHQPGILWKECHSARLRISGTWETGPRDREQYDLLLCTREVLYECEVEVNITKISTIPNEWLLICRAEQNPSQDSKLKLFTHEDQLHWHRKMSSQSECDWVDYEELRLSDFVPYNELKHKEKLILSVILARSLLHLLGTDWLSSDWGMEDISVFYKKHDDPARANEPSELNLRQAYISTQFTKSKGIVDGKALESFHRQPRILRLGIVIMQLMLGDRLKYDEDLRKGRMSSREIKIAAKLYKACELRFSKTWKVLEALRNCTNVHLFSEIDPKESSIEVCRTYYSNIVKLLEEALLQDEEMDLSKVEHEFTSDAAETPKMFNALIKPPLERGTSRILKRDYNSFTEGKDSSPSTKRAAHNECYALAQFEPDTAPTGKRINELWNEELSQLKRFFTYGRTAPMEMADFSKLVKVAIIDTGCNLDHDKIMPHTVGLRKKENGERKFEYQIPGIWGYKDFVDADPDSSRPSMKDTSPDGHGTFMTYLLLDTMPFLQVFIARVFDGSKSSDPDTYTRVASAIAYAVDEWGVDIISMSFHLSGEPKIVETAISNASGRGVLSFAAAGNNLHQKPTSIAFPAILQNVFCINSHNDNTKSSDLTPHERNYSPNFMVIGQNLEGPGDNNTTKYMSGTSCAVPIAAAFAAMVFDYIREHLEQCPSDDREKLGSLTEANTMKWVFFDCMVEGGTEKLGFYNVVKPVQLFRDEWRRRPDAIFSRIMAAIEKRRKFYLH